MPRATSDLLAALHPLLAQALDLGAAEHAGRLASLHDEQPSAIVPSIRRRVCAPGSRQGPRPT